MTAMARNMDFMIRMLKGEKLTTQEMTAETGRSSQTVKRDMRAIGSMVEELPDCEFHQEIVGIENKRFWITINTMSFEEVLALLKILIGTRSLNQAEMTQVKDHLLNLLSEKKQNLAKKLITTTVTAYTPVNAGQDLLPRLAEFAGYIQNRTPIKFTYSSSTQGTNKDAGLPMGLTFADFYYYVVMYSEKNDTTHFYRLDRFGDDVVPDVDQNSNVPRAKKLDEGESLNKTYLLSGGTVVNYEFKYWNFPQTALDRLPKSTCTPNKDGSVTIKGEAFSQGLVLWILSQGSNIQVIRPKSLVDEVQEEIKKMAALY
ncbi:helix-turn-helix transcriptional regulator [Levilactobacillus fuyuanensis]|nr:WYL domain-containing protein [Levilactobacillus fuyuanensis]